MKDIILKVAAEKIQRYGLRKFTIDNKKVIDGSYNWSNNAKYNLEHIIVIESKTVAKMYRNNFENIYENSKYYNFNVYDAK